MTSFSKWQDVRGEIVAGLGGEEAVTEARRRNQAYIDGHRLAERRKALGLTQLVVAERMGVTKSRVSQIERGEVSTIARMTTRVTERDSLELLWRCARESAQGVTALSERDGGDKRSPLQIR
jgi:transcriptional regulator with XRE-family HTH domain